MSARAYTGDETTGFQSPAQDHIEAVPDLADLLELRRPQRFAVRVRGEGLRDRGIHGGDILVDVAISSCQTPRAGIIVASRALSAAQNLNDNDTRILTDLSLERADTWAREWGLRIAVETRADRLRE
jgi:hypothetical protein